MSETKSQQVKEAAEQSNDAKQEASEEKLVLGLEPQARHRILGALVWFLFLFLWLPSWYEHPAHFVPPEVKQVASNQTPSQAKAQPIAQKVYQLPAQPKVPPMVRSSDNAKNAVTHSPVGAAKQKSVKATAKTTAKRPDKTALTGISKSAKAAEAMLQDELMVAKGWFVRLAAFKSMGKANELFGKVEEAGYQGYVKPINKNQYFAVVIGPFASKKEALKVKRKVDKAYFVKSKIFERR